MSLCKARAGLPSCVTPAEQRDPWNHCFQWIPTLGPHWVLVVVGLNSLPSLTQSQEEGWLAWYYREGGVKGKTGR